MAGVKGRSGAPGRRKGWGGGAFRPDLIDEMRARIKTGLILSRLESHILGSLKMSDTQIKAAAILLRKVMPDLQAIDMTANGGGPLVIEIVKFAADTTPAPAIEHEPVEPAQATDGTVH